MPFRFRLRSLFLLIVAAAILSELLKWASGTHESPFVVGFGYFAYGGIAGLTLYTFGVLLSMIASQSPTGQRIGIFAGATVSTIVWLLIVILWTKSWIPVCGTYCVLVVALMVLVTKSDLITDLDVSPQKTMDRLHKAKGEALTSIERRARQHNDEN